MSAEILLIENTMEEQYVYKLELQRILISDDTGSIVIPIFTTVTVERYSLLIMCNKDEQDFCILDTW